MSTVRRTTTSASRLRCSAASSKRWHNNIPCHGRRVRYKEAPPKKAGVDVVKWWDPPLASEFILVPALERTPCGGTNGPDAGSAESTRV